MKYRSICEDEVKTSKLAEKLAGYLRGGEVLQLVGDMGVGKTTFTKALVKALGSHDHVTSPTFTICNQYHGKFTIFHCDFYRLSNDKLIENELEDMLGEQNIVVMEWAENLANLSSIETIDIFIDLLDENTRQFTIKASDKFQYLELE